MSALPSPVTSASPVQSPLPQLYRPVNPLGNELPFEVATAQLLSVLWMTMSALPSPVTSATPAQSPAPQPYSQGPDPEALKCPVPSLRDTIQLPESWVTMSALPSPVTSASPVQSPLPQLYRPVNPLGNELPFEVATAQLLSVLWMTMSALGFVFAL